MNWGCSVPGCSAIVPAGGGGRGRCPVHAVHHEHARRNYDTRRWYRTERWARVRARVLVESCYACAQCDHVRLDLEVDHIQKHDGDPKLFWLRSNLQALCPTCHKRKTIRGE